MCYIMLKECSILINATEKIQSSLLYIYAFHCYKKKLSYHLNYYFQKSKKMSFSILYNTFLCKYYQTKYFFFLYSFPKRWYNLGFGKSNFLQANLTIISLQSLTFRWYTGQTLKWEYLVICLPLDNIHYRDQRFSISWLITFFTDNAYNLFCF